MGGHDVGKVEVGSGLYLSREDGGGGCAVVDTS